jgi:hypothetical protein
LLSSTGILASRIGRSGADRPQRADAIKGMDGCLGETLPGSLLTAERSPHRNRFMKASQGRVSLIIRFFSRAARIHSFRKPGVFVTSVVADLIFHSRAMLESSSAFHRTSRRQRWDLRFVCHPIIHRTRGAGE